MVATPLVSPKIEPKLDSTIEPIERFDRDLPYRLPQTLEEFIANPVPRSEWVDGEIIERTDMTTKHSRTQSRLSRSWGNYALSSKQGGEALVEAPCQTIYQVRRPDVAYGTAEFMAQYGEESTASTAYPLIAEVASPTDMAETLFSKAREYLDSGCLEVWMIFPENRWIMILTATQHLWFTSGETAKTQQVLVGFEISVDELMS
jgi:Uma2 family endonuclease